MGFISDNFKRKQNKPVAYLKNYNLKTFAANPVTKHDIKGVHYKKGENWRDNYYALTKEVLIKDFGLMKEIGINTIQFSGGNIYDHNLLKYSEQFDLKVIYEFGIDNSMDFINGRENLNSIREEIITEVKNLKGNQTIIGYSFKYALGDHFTKPLLFDQQTAYLNWLYSLTSEIKSIDPRKSLIVELHLNLESINTMNYIRKNLPIDSYVLLVNDPMQLDEVLAFTKNNEISVFISNIKPEIFAGNTEKFKNLEIIMANWQDERRSNRLTFDGLLDFNGDKRQIFGNLKNIWTKYKEEIGDQKVKILKTSEPIFPGRDFKYFAVLFIDNKWTQIPNSKKNYHFEWNLVKKDLFGNPLALKLVGTGAELNLKIPEDYQHYDLLLIAKNKASGDVLRSKTILNTPTQH